MPRGVGVRVPLSAQGERAERWFCSFFVRTKCHAPPVAPWATCLRRVAMCHVAMQLWVCAESNYLCKHKVALNTYPQSTIACTSLPFSVTSRLLRTFESPRCTSLEVSASANLFRLALALLTAVRVLGKAELCIFQKKFLALHLIL